MADEKICDHIDSLQKLKHAKDYVCEECVKHGGNWVHLRTCQECGITLCCDSSPQTHMTKHNHATGHPIIISAETGERWIYCYADDVMAEY
jgi:hypothetical protein